MSLRATLLILPLVLVSTPVYAGTLEELQAQLATAAAQISTLKGGASQTGAQAGTLSACPTNSIGCLGGAGKASSPSSLCLVDFPRKISRGMSGTDVSAAQRILQSLGDYTYAEITGYYGSATRQAVQRFQCRVLNICSGAETTTGYGRIGPSTRSALLRSCIAKEKVASGPVSETVEASIDDTESASVAIPAAPSTMSGINLNSIDERLKDSNSGVNDSPSDEEVDL